MDSKAFCSRLLIFLVFFFSRSLLAAEFYNQEPCSFISSIITNPADDNLLLVFADYLEENRYPGQAKLIRLQVEINLHYMKGPNTPKLAELERQKTELIARSGNLTGFSKEFFFPGKRFNPYAISHNFVKFDLSKKNPGKFIMGSPEDEPGRDPDREAQHPVELTEPFELAAYLVNQAEFAAVTGENPSENKAGAFLWISDVIADPLRPVENVSYNQGLKFYAALDLMNPGWHHRAATEAEWEFATKGGSSTMFHYGSDTAKLPEYAWFYDNAGRFRRGSMPIGRLKPNANGLYDMHGNVWEWTSDAFIADHGSLGVKNPKNLGDENSWRMCRGGGWANSPRGCRSANRSFISPPDGGDGDQGLRVLRTKK